MLPRAHPRRLPDGGRDRRHVGRSPASAWRPPCARRRPIRNPMPAGILGATAAFVFAAQMINIPVAPGISGHLVGAALSAVLLGPWRAMIVMAVVLAVQALLFQDGGITALGANTLDMGVGGVAHRVMPWPRCRPGGCASAPRHGRRRRARRVCGHAGLRRADRRSGWGSPVCIRSCRSCSSCWSRHVAIGLLEAALTGAVLATVVRWRPGPRSRRVGDEPLRGVGRRRRRRPVRRRARRRGVPLAVRVGAAGRPRPRRRTPRVSRAARPPSWPAPFPDYALPFLSSPAIATAAAGIAGTLLRRRRRLGREPRREQPARSMASPPDRRPAAASRARRPRAGAGGRADAGRADGRPCRRGRGPSGPTVFAAALVDLPPRRAAAAGGAPPRRAGSCPWSRCSAVPAALLAPSGSRLRRGRRARAPARSRPPRWAPPWRRWLGPSGLVRAVRAPARCPTARRRVRGDAGQPDASCCGRCARCCARARRDGPAFGALERPGLQPGRHHPRVRAPRRLAAPAVARTGRSDRAGAARPGRRGMTPPGEPPAVGFDVSRPDLPLSGRVARPRRRRRSACRRRARRRSSGPTARASPRCCCTWPGCCPSGAATCTCTNRAGTRTATAWSAEITIGGTTGLACDHRPHPRSRRHRVPGSRRPADRPDRGRGRRLRPARAPMAAGGGRARGARRRCSRSASTATNTARRTTSRRARSAASAWPACWPARPGLLLLDEPSSGLDPRGRRSLAALLRGLAATIIVASHDLAFIQQVCTRRSIDSCDGRRQSCARRAGRRSRALARPTAALRVAQADGAAHYGDQRIGNASEGRSHVGAPLRLGHEVLPAAWNAQCGVRGGWGPTSRRTPEMRVSGLVEQRRLPAPGLAGRTAT